MMGNDTPTEQRRYDGAPAPPRNAGVGIGDARAAAEDARREASCEHCDEDDWECLKPVPRSHVHHCDVHQKEPPDPIILCDDCREDHTPFEAFCDSLREADEVKVLFECGVAESLEQPESDDARPSKWGPREKIPARCLCNAEIEEVFY